VRRRALLIVAAAATVALAAPAASAPPTPGTPGNPGPGRAAPGQTVDATGLLTRSASAGAEPDAAVAADPQLEAGYPLTTYSTGGSFHAGPVNSAVVGELDGDATLEICASAIAAGPVHCWNHDGRRVPGWGPSRGFTGVGYVAIGPLSPAAPRAVVVGYFGDLLAAYDPAGSPLPGWPIESSNFISGSPTITAVGSKGVVLTGEEDWHLHAYRADATVPPGWPTTETTGGQERHTPAVADVDGDGSPEIFSVSGWTSPGVYLFANHANGDLLPGYPVLFQGEVDTFPAVGDVDGDGELEVVIIGARLDNPSKSTVIVVTAATGAIEGMALLQEDAAYGSAPALADLDQSCAADALVEIVVQTEGRLYALRWNGSSFSDYPGWPVRWSATQWLGDSSPTVGDIDGDGLPDIAITGQNAGDAVRGKVYAYSRNGTPLAGFPKRLPIGSGSAPAIADLDLDGRNELVVRGSPWDGFSGAKPTIWVYDLGGAAYGPVHWGQFMHDSRHTGRYMRPGC
jgi:hypothetical protein